MVREAMVKDYEAVAALMKEEHVLHQKARPDIFSENAENYSFREYEKFLQQPGSLALVAEERGSVVGLCFGSLYSSRVTDLLKPCEIAYIEDFIVTKQYRKKKIGTALYAGWKKKAKEVGAVRIELTVWAFNDGAERFYQSLGMRIQGFHMEQDI